MRKPIPKSVRKQVYAKYNGHCAYCGCEIPEKGFNVDHLHCLRNYEYTEEFTGIDVHDISNLMPEKRDTSHPKACYTNSYWTDEMNAGFNACLDEITGGASGISASDDSS